MQSEIMAALITTIPGILWVILAIILAALLYRPISRDILPRMGGIQAFGVELTFLREGMERIGAESSRSITAEQVDQVSRRAYRLATVLQGATVLWVDDHPAHNNYERRFLNSVGVLVDIATSSDEARRMLGNTFGNYDLILSDIERRGDKSAGLGLLAELRSIGVRLPLIFYTSRVDPARGIPTNAFGIADAPDELMNLVMDALERSRG